MKLFLLIITVCLIQADLQATAMGDLAAGMKAGEWKQLVTQNIATVLAEPGDGATGGVLGYAEKGAWDPQSEQFFFLGTDHMYSGLAQSSFVAYSAAANAWRALPKPYWVAGTTMHGYDHIAINPATSEIYYRSSNAKRAVWRYRRVQDVWQMASSMPTTFIATDDLIACCIGVVYFPELKGLVYADGDQGSIYSYGTTTAKWTMHATGLPMGPYHNFAEYNPVHKVVVCGGGNGSSDLYKVDSTGKVTTLKDAPLGLGICQSIFTVDPVGGDYLVFGADGSFYVYDVLSDTWTRQPGNDFFSPVNGGGTSDGRLIWYVVATPVSSYGVTIFVKFNFASSSVYLYKHSVPAATEHSPSLAAGGLEITPNPVTDRAVIRAWNTGMEKTRPFQMEAFDIRGVKVSTLSGDSENRAIWNAGNLPAGIYVINIKTGSRTLSKKVLVSK